MRREILILIAILFTIVCVGLVNAEQTAAPTSLDELLNVVNRKIGYQARVIVDFKPIPQREPSANPFLTDPTVKPRDLWMPLQVVVALDTPFGPQIIGQGGNYEMAW